MSPAFIVINVGALVLMASAWSSGWFAILSMIEWHEIIMLFYLIGYFGIGLIAAGKRAWETVGHITDGLPMYGLCFTGVSLLLALGHLTSSNADVVMDVFKYMTLAIIPNILGAWLMIWLREIAYWTYRDEETF